MATPVGSIEVDFRRIKYPKVREFMARHGLLKPDDFKSMCPICYDNDFHDSYHSHHESFLVYQPVDLVWNIYKTIPPAEAWNGEMVSFGLQYARKTNAINYINDSYIGMEEGQIIILNLRLFWGLLNLAVAHEVMEVNDQEKILKLCYMQGGASEGSQWIKLSETTEGFTSVSHQTYYKSGSDFRDRKLYPSLHTKAISEFHQNVKVRAEAGNALLYPLNPAATSL